MRFMCTRGAIVVLEVLVCSFRMRPVVAVLMTRVWFILIAVHCKMKERAASA